MCAWRAAYRGHLEGIFDLLHLPFPHAARHRVVMSFLAYHKFLPSRYFSISFFSLKYSLQVLSCTRRMVLALIKVAGNLSIKRRGSLRHIPVKGRRAIRRIVARGLFPNTSPILCCSYCWWVNGYCGRCDILTFNLYTFACKIACHTSRRRSCAVTVAHSGYLRSKT